MASQDSRNDVKLSAQLLARDQQDIIRLQIMSNHQFPPDHLPIVLAADTSQSNASFAIAKGNTILASSQSDGAIPHSRSFFYSLTTLLQGINLSFPEIEIFAAAVGPGSFTGLRVGLAAIKGLSHGLGKPVIGLSSVDAIALASRALGKVMVLIEAGREDVYVGLRDITLGSPPQVIGNDAVGRLPVIIGPFKQYIRHEVVTVAGLGNLGKYLDFVPSHWQTANIITTPAEAIALYVGGTFNNQLSQGIHPYYIRPSDAEIKRAG